MLMFGGLSETFISIGIWIVTGIYKVANFAFEIFIILATGNLIETEDYELMIENFYIIIGVIMLFVLAFALLKGMVNPDDQKKGTETVKKVIVNLISSGIILVLLPTIFAFAFDFQDSIISYNSIGKFFGYGSQDVNNDSTSAVGQVKEGAYTIVNGVFTAFLNINAEECDEYISSNNIAVDSAKEKLIECQKHQESEDDETLYDVIAYVDKNGTYGKYVGFAENIDDSEMDFDFLLSVVAGALLIYVGVSFCFDMAVRLVKLVFYQLIAPVPLFMRVVPNSKFSDIFSKWTKVTITCYLEVYIRIVIFYFCIYLCKAMVESSFLSETVYGYGPFIGLLTKAFVLMGIITFMRQAPILVQEVTGIDSGNMKLGIKDKLAQGGAFTAGAILGGGLTSFARNATAAGHNIRNRWNQDKKNDVTTRKRILHAAGGVGSLLKSSVAGGIAGAARSGKDSWTAKSYGDMKNAVKKGSQDTVDARVKRANYRAAHSTGKGYWSDLGHVITGHALDKAAAAGSYVGLKNAEQLKRENYAMDLITNARDKFDNDADALIDKEMAKGKTKLAYGTGAGEFIDLEQLSIMKRNLDNARATGTVTKEMEEEYNMAKRDARYKLQNATLISNKNWDKLTDSDEGNEIRAKLSSLRVDAVNYKGEIRNNASLDALKNSGIVGGDFADDKDYIVSQIKTKPIPVYGEVEVDQYETKMVDVFEDRAIEYYEDSSLLDKNGKPLKIKKTRTEKVKVGERPERVKIGTRKERQIIGEREVSYFDDNEIIDKMGKEIKTQKGSNSIAIAQQEQQKYEESKK